MDSAFIVGKNYYPQTFSKESKFNLKGELTKRSITENLKDSYSNFDFE